MKLVQGTKNVYSNVDDFMDGFMSEMETLEETLTGWKWVLWNDLPYANVVDGGFTHHLTGQAVSGRFMLDTMENIIDQANLPLMQIGQRSLNSIKQSTDRFFEGLLEMAKTTQITPIRSGLLAKGAANVISYMKADPRYRDDFGYQGWSLDKP